MNYPAASCGVSKAHHANASHSVIPKFLVRGPDPDWPGFPLKRAGMTDFGLAVAKTQQAAGNQPQAIEKIVVMSETLMPLTKPHALTFDRFR